MPDAQDGKLDPDLDALARNLEGAVRQADAGAAVADRVAEMEHAIQGLRQEVASLRMRLASADSPRAASVFLARADGTNGAWAEMSPSGAGTSATLVDFPDGRIETSRPLSASSGSNQVRAMLAIRTIGAMQYVPLPVGVILVSLSNSSGSNGTSTAAPTYKYDVKAAKVTAAGTVTAGQTLLSDKAPLFGRAFGPVDLATLGLAIEASDGGYVLLYAHEVVQTEECT